MAAPMRKLLTKIIPQTGERASGSVIFLHGSGDTGAGIQGWVNDVLEVNQLTFPHLRILFPTAPARPYTPNFGQLSNVWYNRQDISPLSPDDESVDVMASTLTELVKSENQLGIQLNRIIIGGFSMGGGMAMHLGYRYLRDVAGVFALSSFLGMKTLVYQALQTNKTKVPPLFQAHGNADSLVLYEWGKDTYEMLTSLGVEGQFHTIPGLSHDLDKDTLIKLCSWINNLVPNNSP